MLTRKALTLLLTEVQKELAVLGFPPRRMILFGSYAKGGVHKFSDVDIAIWHEDFTGNKLIDLEKLTSLFRKFKSIDLHTFPVAATATNFDPFIEVIEKNGIEIRVTDSFQLM